MNETSNLRKFYGKYRGTVVNNVDPMQMGRLLITVPDVLGPGVPSSWAEPCVPLAGPTGPPMGVYLVPPPGAGVWVEFEQGDPERPIWVGCRWGAPSDIPPLARIGLPVSPSIVLQTATQNVIVISDVPGPTGGIMLQVGTSVVMINQTGISLTAATKIDITAPSINLTGITDINKGALRVT